MSNGNVELSDRKSVLNRNGHLFFSGTSQTTFVKSLISGDMKIPIQILSNQQLAVFAQNCANILCVFPSRTRKAVITLSIEYAAALHEKGVTDPVMAPFIVTLKQRGIGSTHELAVSFTMSNVDTSTAFLKQQHRANKFNAPALPTLQVDVASKCIDNSGGSKNCIRCGTEVRKICEDCNKGVCPPDTNRPCFHQHYYSCHGEGSDKVATLVPPESGGQGKCQICSGGMRKSLVCSICDDKVFLCGSTRDKNFACFRAHCEEHHPGKYLDEPFKTKPINERKMKKVADNKKKQKKKRKQREEEN